ncbi:MAG: IS66-like element accessory protein TnpA [Terriglobales bacterium]
MEAEDGSKARRVRRSVEEKQRIVALAGAAGASVARIARENGVNSNQVYAWLRLAKLGRLGEAADPGTLLAVRVAPERPARHRSQPAGGGGVWQELRRGSVRVENGADPVLLRVVLEQLAE